MNKFLSLACSFSETSCNFHRLLIIHKISHILHWSFLLTLVILPLQLTGNSAEVGQTEISFSRWTLLPKIISHCYATDIWTMNSQTVQSPGSSRCCLTTLSSRSSFLSSKLNFSSVSLKPVLLVLSLQTLGKSLYWKDAIRCLLSLESRKCGESSYFRKITELPLCQVLPSSLAVVVYFFL